MLNSGSLPKFLFTLTVVLLISLGFFLAWPFTVDDAYIVFRYAQHLAAGQGLVWNPGERVEGFTSFLWTLFMALPARFGWSLPKYSKFLGSISLLILLWLVCVTGRRYGSTWWTRVWPACAIVLTPATYFHAVSGLETMLYTLLLFIVFVLTFDAVSFGKLSRPALVILPLLAFLTALVRPEGILPTTFALAAGFLAVSAEQRRVLAIVTLFAFAMGVAYLAWRYSYFGYLLQNTAYAKASKGLSWSWLDSSAHALLPLGILLAISWLLLPKPMPIVTGILYAAVAMVPYTFFHLTMDYARRFLFPVLPVLLFLTGVGVNRLIQEGFLRKYAARVTLGFIMLFYPLFLILPSEAIHLAIYGPHLERAHVNLGRALAQLPVKSEWRTLAIGDAGAVSYYSGWKVIDYIGLNDPYIAHGFDPTERVIASEPSIVFLYSRDGFQPRLFQYGLVSVRLGKYWTLYSEGSVQWMPDYFLLPCIRMSLPRETREVIAEALARVGSDSREANHDAGLTELVRITFQKLKFLCWARGCPVGAE